MTDRIIEMPISNPNLFSPAINREVLAQGKIHALLAAAIHALPYVTHAHSREELKQALCDILLLDRAA